MVLYASLFILALVMSLCITPVVRAAARWVGVFDVPDRRRKLHLKPVPKLGGVAVFISFYVCLWLVSSELESPSARAAFQLAAALFVPSLMILVLGIADDLWSVGPWGKIAVQTVAGLIVYYQLGIRVDVLASPIAGDVSALGLLSLPATLFWIVLITNAFNVVDGMDGLATGVAFIALSCMFIVSLQMGQPAIAFAALPLAGAVLGFLRYNFNPASIFLGDSGSLFLGFQLAVLSIVGSQKSSTAVAVTAPLFVLALPLIETAMSTVRRFVTGRAIMKADSGHMHHQLVRLGFSPRRAVGVLYLASGAFGLASLFIIQSGSARIGLIAVVFALVTWVAIQQLGYTEFAEINGAMRRFVSQRRIMQHGIICRKLADDLAESRSVGEAWSILKGAARRLGFSNVELNLHSRLTGGYDARATQYVQRLTPAPLFEQEHETTFSVALAGARGTLGQAVFSRPVAAAPLHSELPLFISAVAQSLPRVIERSITPVALPPAPRAAGSSPIHATARAEREVQWVQGRGPVTMTCTSCRSAGVYRSRSRSRLERIRKKFTDRRLHACDSCGWRGWRMPEAVPSGAQLAPMTSAEAPDLEAVDLALQNIQESQGDAQSAPMTIAEAPDLASVDLVHQ